ncbi:hypothetical protein DUNSADRAFT_9858 [Dunaliella salina]|uniref:Encoded protein n=1 Tax=Dunaliella salina TaxID=3046 RepID=A0ABQ7H544_DUNSA|nr:hypothetical protein DUNSADRAFT_9858 [Dunaliella salina]|eukprot:KAF5841977.1 hypothetical protein DUNSADRAFT_9858 [Dunaliella salina]
MHVLASNDSIDVFSTWPPAAAHVGEGSLLQQPTDAQQLELVVMRKEASPSSCRVSFISTARTVELLADEEGTGKFSYLSSCRGSPCEGLFVMKITLPASVKQAKLRMLSRSGDRKACLVQALQCTTRGDGGPHQDASSSSSCCQPEPGSATNASEQPLSASAEETGPLPGTAHQEPQPQTQAAQIRQLLQHAAQPEGASLESLPSSLHHLSQKMAQAASGSAGGGSMMSQLVQDLARKALLQPTSSPAPLQENQGPRGLGQAQPAQDATQQAEQHRSVPERLQRLETTVAAMAAAIQRIESGQHSILQGQHAILSRLEQSERRSTAGSVSET